MNYLNKTFVLIFLCLSLFQTGNSILIQNPQIGPQFQTFLNRVNSVPDSMRTAIVDSFMATIPAFPLLEDTCFAYFIYRGSANSVTVPGDANGWSPTSFPMTKISGTNFWYNAQVFESDARLDYKFVLNGGNWITDPRNPFTVMGGYGPNSELAMPLYVRPPELIYSAAIPHGTISDTTFYSAILNNSRTIRVYKPSNYDQSPNDSYPIVLFHDGLEYISLAYTSNILDYLIAHNHIQPVIGVFVPPVNRMEEYAGSLTSQFSQFIVTELMPYIDNRYRTKTDSSSRAMVGVSAGGLISTDICFNYPQDFALCGAFSPSYWANGMQVYNLVVSQPKRDIAFYVDWGIYEPSIMVYGRSFRDSLISKNYILIWKEWHEGHSWGSWRAHLDIALEFFFPGPNSILQQKHVIPNRIDLHQNYPNPFNPTTTIEFSIPKSEYVTLKIYNLLGQEVATLVSDELTAGKYQFAWNASGFASGIYLYKIQTGTYQQLRKMMLLK